MADVTIAATGTTSAPLSYTVAGAQEIIIRSLFASFDGTGAAGAFLPCVQVVSPAGQVVIEAITDASVAAGSSADVTFAPFLRSVTSTTPPPSGSTLPFCFASDNHSTLPLGTTHFSFSDDFQTNDATTYDTIVSGGLTLVRIKVTGFYVITCQTTAIQAHGTTGPLTSGWAFSPAGHFTGYEYEFGTPMGIQVDDGSENNWLISSQQLLDVISTANVALSRFVDNGASGAIGTQNTDIFVERISDSI